MKLSLLEQETVLLYNQAESAAEVYTHDPKLMKKLEQLAEKYPEQIIKKDDHNFIVPKRCVFPDVPLRAGPGAVFHPRGFHAGFRFQHTGHRWGAGNGGQPDQPAGAAADRRNHSKRGTRGQQRKEPAK